LCELGGGGMGSILLVGDWLGLLLGLVEGIADGLCDGPRLGLGVEGAGGYGKEGVSQQTYKGDYKRPRFAKEPTVGL
ncbi:hypothetical protein THAOC_26280, partial [Thalassiosira oceanica]